MQARLVLGVRAEQDACKDALMRLYKRCALFLAALHDLACISFFPRPCR